MRNNRQNVFKAFNLKIRKSARKIYGLCKHSVVGICLAFCSVNGTPMNSYANPENGVVVGGSATITTTPAELQIHQASDRALIEWSSFDIDSGETTRFYQPNSSSVALNRVVNSNQLSKINGNLIANGKVIVINPNGVLIGPGGNIDTAGFIASSADVENDTFLSSSKMQFSKGGKAGAVIENNGSITVREEGLAALVAPTVRNNGLIQANLSKVQLAGADTYTLDLYGDGLINLAVKSPPDDSNKKLEVENKGSIIADGGSVLMTAATASDVVSSVINNEGVIQAKSLVNHNGEIILTGGNADVKVKGKLDVTGEQGGGKIKLGGDFQGKGTLAKAKTLNIDKDAIISANAHKNGNGGTIIAWSENHTEANGKFYSRGGSESGNGGLVETSSKGVLNVDNAIVNTLAPKGRAGTWLLDPDNINIKSSGVPYTPLPGSGTSDIDASTINNAASNVILQANNSITVQNPINMTNPGVGIYLISGTSGADISANVFGTLTGLTAGTGSFSMNGGNYIKTNGGDVGILAGKSINIGNSTIISNGGDVALTSGDIIFNNNAAISTKGGDVTFIAIASGSGANQTTGTINTDTAKIDTTNDLSPAVGGFTFIENGSTLPLGNYGNPRNIFVQTQNGGKITINGKDIGGINVCFAAGGPGCIISNPITPILISIFADPQSKIYGAADPFLSYIYTGTINAGDAFTGALTRNPGENVGSYAITQGTLNIAGTSGATYNINYTGNFLTINPYVLAVIANAQTKVYGSADPALTYSFSALQNGDTASIFSGNLERVAGETVAGGPYAINLGTLNAGSNYTIDYTGNFLNITPYLLTVNANAQTKVYGSADPALTYNFGALQNGDTASIFSGNLERVAGETVTGGPYAINLGTLSAGSNYTIDYTGNFLNITPYVLAVMADPQSKQVGNPDPALTYVFGTLQNGDTASVFTGNLSRDVGEAAGTYQINQHTLSAGSNYTIAYTGNLFTITAIPIVTPAAPLVDSLISFNPLGRPIISVADQTIVTDLPFEPFDTYTLNTDVGIAASPALLSSLEPASGNVTNLNNLEPASGGSNIQNNESAAVNNNISCANNFLGNKPCDSTSF